MMRRSCCSKERSEARSADCRSICKSEKRKGRWETHLLANGVDGVVSFRGRNGSSGVLSDGDGVQESGLLSLERDIPIGHDSIQRGGNHAVAVDLHKVDSEGDKPVSTSKDNGKKTHRRGITSTPWKVTSEKEERERGLAD